MTRHIVPLTFFTAMFLGVVLPLAPQVVALGSTDKVPNVAGAYDGFFQVGGTGAIGLVHSVIDQQIHRRFQGFVLFATAENSLRFNAINFAATVTEAEFLTGNGKALSGPTVLSGRAVLKGGLLSSDGVEGPAVVLEPTFRFVPRRGIPVDVSTLLLHPFPDAESPNLAGFGVGTFRSRAHFQIGGTVNMVLEKRAPGGSFPGTLRLMIPGQDQDFPFQLLATSSENQKFMMIAQGGAGRLAAEGVIIPPTEQFPTPSVNALYRLIPFEGRVDFGAINFSLGPG
jgi:hypothetical protein